MEIKVNLKNIKNTSEKRADTKYNLNKNFVPKRMSMDLESIYVKYKTMTNRIKSIMMSGLFKEISVIKREVKIV